LFAKADSQRRVLLALKDTEDQKVLQTFINFNFGEKIHCMTAADGVAATSKIQYQSFHCIVADLDLPKKSGEALLGSIRNSGLNNQTPVILIKDKQAPDFESEFSGVDFFDRPLDGSRFLMLIGKTLRLGKGDQKLCASLINFVTAGVQNFFAAYRERPLEAAGPFVGLASLMTDDLCSLVTLKSADSEIQLVVSFSSSVLSEMRSELQFLKFVDSQNIAQSLLVFTFQRVLKSYSEFFNLRPQIEIASKETLLHLEEKEVIFVELRDDLEPGVKVFVLRGE